MNNFVKSHGLGNDYIVMDLKKINFKLDKKRIKEICHRNYGIGADGILLLVNSKKADFGLKIYNPDGTEAEKSGNGLRIFSKYLYDYKYTKKRNFLIETKGGIVHSEVILKNKKIKDVKVDMGVASFESKKIPVKTKNKYSINQRIKVKNQSFTYSSVTVGNPHCVIFLKKASKDLALKFGRLIEENKLFPKRTNVQFAQIISKNKVKIEIWERGAGYTLASGSSSCGVVSVGYKLGLLSEKVEVIMPGGKLYIEIDKDYKLTMKGPVEEICNGQLKL
ncbi:MAG: diaminopimelate epimerase [Thermodesulfobacteriota bacterium]|nr:MAG: diaminopimelate epimerase [Candidatus Dadabacteria bacterium]|tara:strand:- start:54424 stop:55257 length:834 start_codon:yes stop_codon:yes gene_type:complete